jgi:hypothetical protein
LKVADFDSVKGNPAKAVIVEAAKQLEAEQSVGAQQVFKDPVEVDNGEQYVFQVEDEVHS